MGCSILSFRSFPSIACRVFPFSSFSAFFTVGICHELCGFIHILDFIRFCVATTIELCCVFSVRVNYICCILLIEALWLFIIKGFRTIVFLFIVISTTFRPICPPAFFRCLSNSGTFTELGTLLNPRGLPVLIPLAITGYKYSCIVTCLQSGLNLQPPDDCLFRSLGNQRL